MMFSISCNHHHCPAAEYVFQLIEVQRMNKMVHILSVRCDDLTAQVVKTVPAMQENWVQSVSWEDPREEGMATHSSILAWGNPVDIGVLWVTVHRVTKSQARLSTHTHTHSNLWVCFCSIFKAAQNSKGNLSSPTRDWNSAPTGHPRRPLGS